MFNFLVVIVAVQSSGGRRLRTAQVEGPLRGGSRGGLWRHLVAKL